MKVFDVMTTEVLSVSPDTPVPQIAKLLVEHGISAVPVVDESGAPLGMVSEGDLITHREVEREARRDWWLELLAEGEAVNPVFLAELKGLDHKARDVMHCPVVTVAPDTGVAVVAQLLTANSIKRVPVVQDKRIIGIVSRADLVRGLAEHPGSEPSAVPKNFLAGAIDNLDEHFLATRHKKVATPRVPTSNPEPAEDHMEAAEFRHAVEEFEEQQIQKRAEVDRAAEERLRVQIKELLDQHVSDVQWHDLLKKAHAAAKEGQKELLLLRFPSQLCSDGGRMINVPDPSWPSSLRGEAAEIYTRWYRDLRPHGFHLTAQILDFPDGIPGDAGLTLIWGK
jgi:CBS domain-containing protein